MWQVVLEDIRSQNRLTIEAVEATRESLEQNLDQKFDGLHRRFDDLDQKVDGLDQKVEGLDQKIDRIDGETRLRDAAIEGGLRELRVELDKSRVDVRLTSLEGHRAREGAGLNQAGGPPLLSAENRRVIFTPPGTRAVRARS